MTKSQEGERVQKTIKPDNQPSFDEWKKSLGVSSLYSVHEEIEDENVLSGFIKGDLYNPLKVGMIKLSQKKFSQTVKKHSSDH